MNRTLLAATLAAAGALSIVPLHAESINACVDSQNGLLRIVAPGTACNVNQYPLEWQRQGPQGPAGPTGPQGPMGPPGWGGNAIGWQAAADDWGFVQAFVVCVLQ